MKKASSEIKLEAPIDLFADKSLEEIAEKCLREAYTRWHYGSATSQDVLRMAMAYGRSKPSIILTNCGDDYKEADDGSDD